MKRYLLLASVVAVGALGCGQAGPTADTPDVTAVVAAAAPNEVVLKLPGMV